MLVLSTGFLSIFNSTIYADTFFASASSTQQYSSVSVVCLPISTFVNSSVICNATVFGFNPSGIITWSSNSSTGTFNSTTSPLASGFSTVTYNDTQIGTVTITATYGGDANNLPSNDSIILKIAQIADFNFDGKINFLDIVFFVNAYIEYIQNGFLNPFCDLNHDGTIDFQDFMLFVTAYILVQSPPHRLNLQILLQRLFLQEPVFLCLALAMIIC